MGFGCNRLWFLGSLAPLARSSSFCWWLSENTLASHHFCALLSFLPLYCPIFRCPGLISFYSISLLSSAAT